MKSRVKGNQLQVDLFSGATVASVVIILLVDALNINGFALGKCLYFLAGADERGF